MFPIFGTPHGEDSSQLVCDQLPPPPPIGQCSGAFENSVGWIMGSMFRSSEGLGKALEMDVGFLWIR